MGFLTCVLKQILPLHRSQKYWVNPSLSSQDDQKVVGMHLKHVLHIPCLQYVLVVPYMPLFLLFVAHSSGTGLIVSCGIGVLSGLSVLASDLLWFLDRQIYYCQLTPLPVCSRVIFWFIWGSGCKKSVVGPLYINHTSIQFFPKIEVATLLSPVFICNFRSMQGLSCLWWLCWSIPAHVLYYILDHFGCET